MEAGRKGERAEGIIRWASRVEPEWLADLAPLETCVEVDFDQGKERVTAVEKLSYRGLTLRECTVPPPRDLATTLLATQAAKELHSALRLSREAENLIGRCRFLARTLPDLDFPSWSEKDWEQLLTSVGIGMTSFDELRRADLLHALRAHLGHARLQLLDRLAPARMEVPSGSRLAMEYPDTGPPSLSVKIQEVFGWRQGPAVAAGAVPVVLHLLAPSGRPLQVTADLESFWSRTYSEIRKEMRGRYPKHHWPEDPWSAPPSSKTTCRRPTR
jgi:ATP-dependent helicase HrpB